jgi:hypothetical protein
MEQRAMEINLEEQTIQRKVQNIQQNNQILFTIPIILKREVQWELFRMTIIMKNIIREIKI